MSLVARNSGLFWLTALTLAVSLVLGGGTRPGFLSDAILQVLSVPLFLAAAWHLPALMAEKEMRWPVAFAGSVLALPLLQLIPLPPEMWTALPGREIELQSFEVAGLRLPWMPISLFPTATWLSFLSLVPPVGIFLAVLQLQGNERRQLTLVLLTVGVISVGIGFFQVAQGSASPLRFFEITFRTDAVGFFANRNHFSAFLNCLIIICVAWTLHVYAMRERKFAASPSLAPTAYSLNPNLAIGALLILFVVLIAAQAVARSRTGLALTIVSLLGSLSLVAFLPNRQQGSRAAKLMLLMAVLAATFMVQFALFGILKRFNADPMADARLLIATRTWQVAKSLFPAGAGSGSFVRSYATDEPVRGAIPDTYINHAHNEFLEAAMEGGALSLFLLAAFGVWLTIKVIHLWKPAGRDAEHLPGLFPFACALIVVLLAAHSLTDYPLRTGGMLAVAAMVCGILTAGTEDKIIRPARAAFERTPFVGRARTETIDLKYSAKPVPRPWSANNEWPDEWKQK